MKTPFRLLIGSLAIIAAGALHAAPPHYAEWRTFGSESGLPSDKVMCVLATDEAIWAGTDHGLARYRNGRWTTFTKQDGLAHEAVLSLAQDADSGDIWIATMGGLTRYSAGRMDSFTQLNSGLANNVVYSVTAHRGEVWAATAAGVSRYRIAQDQWTIFDESNSPMHERWCYSVTAADDTIYVGVWGGGLLEYQIGRDHWKHYRDPDGEMEIDLLLNDGLVHDIVAAVACDDLKRVWAGTYFGLSSYDGHRWRNFMDHDSPLISNFINFVRPRGTYCFLATDDGLNATDRENWWSYRRDPETGKGIVTWRPAEGPAEHWITETIFPHNFILGIDFQGDDIWLATENGLAVGKLSAKGRVAGKKIEPPPAAKPGSPGDDRYGMTPDAAMPYRRLGKPYKRFFLEKQPFLGTGREKKAPAQAETVRIGFCGPLGDAPDADLGQDMLDGARLAVEQANAAGGFKGIPFELVIRPDLGLWGATSDVMVQFKYTDDVLAAIGSIDGANTHIALRVALKTETLMVNTGDTDPTLTETNIPWLMRCMADDRQQGYALAHHVYKELGLKRVAAFRVNSHYGKMGIGEFRDAARRFGRPLVTELRWAPGDRDFSAQLDRIEKFEVEAVVLWGNAVDTADIVREIRRRKLPVRLFGGDRMTARGFLDRAGEAAEGLVVAATYNPTSGSPKLKTFTKSFNERFSRRPEAFAAHAYDGTTMLIEAIQEAGLNRARIRDAVYRYTRFDGVTGPIHFDATMNDVGPVYIATVKNGRLEYQPSKFNADRKEEARSKKPYRAMSDSPALARSPDRATGKAPDSLRLGCFMPLDEKGRATLNGMRRALDDDAARNPELAAIKLVVHDTRASWGGNTDGLVGQVFDDGALAVIGSTEREGTHLIELVAARMHFPVVSLCGDDPSINAIPLPWIFCVAPRAEEGTQDKAPSGRDFALGYDAAGLLAAKIRTGALSRRALRDALGAERGYRGRSGMFSFDALGRRVEQGEETAEPRPAAGTPSPGRSSLD